MVSVLLVVSLSLVLLENSFENLFVAPSLLASLAPDREMQRRVAVDVLVKANEATAFIVERLDAINTNIRREDRCIFNLVLI